MRIWLLIHHAKLPHHRINIILRHSSQNSELGGQGPPCWLSCTCLQSSKQPLVLDGSVLVLRCFQRIVLRTPFNLKDLSIGQWLRSVFGFSTSHRHLPFAFLHPVHVLDMDCSTQARGRDDGGKGSFHLLFRHQDRSLEQFPREPRLSLRVSADSSPLLSRWSVLPQDHRASEEAAPWCPWACAKLFLSHLEEKPDCSKARCEVQFSPRCPEDSVLIEGYAPPGECCPLPSRCVCDPAGCLRKVCQPGYLNILVSKASGKPGECCDLYECKPGMQGRGPGSLAALHQRVAAPPSHPHHVGHCKPSPLG